MEDIMQNENWISRAYKSMLEKYRGVKQTGKYDSASDIVQEGVYNFLKLNRSYDSYEHVYNSLNKSIYYVMAGRFNPKDKVNNLRTIVSSVPDVLTYESDTYNIDNEMDEIIVKVKESYPILNMYYQGYNQTEIGEVHGYSQARAWQLMGKEIESLKKELNV
jgi:DNA-directed RNA polymerase specialized sigma24 family protein